LRGRAAPAPLKMRKVPKEEQSSETPLYRKISAELLGTFFITLVATAVDIVYFTTGDVDNVCRWLARGFVTAAVIYAFSEISGAHLDPAISLGFVARGVLPAKKAVLYVAAQVTGAFLAAGVVWLRWGPSIALGASHPGAGESAAHALVAEVILTFMLMTVILATADADFAVGKQAALAVGFTVAACGFVGGPISGASMNPARSIAPQILGGSFGLVWIYIVGPCLGALLAAAVAPLLLDRPNTGERKAAEGK
jgi:aquaporin Z